MRLANTVVGPAYYHLGLIDILQTWTLKKRMERVLKIAFKGVDGDGLSAIQPTLYKKRFQQKMADILGVEDLVGQGADDVFAQQNSHMDLDTERVSQLNVQLIRELTTNDHLVSADAHYVDGRYSRNQMRQRSFDRSASSQSVGQDTEEYAGIDYHL